MGLKKLKQTIAENEAVARARSMAISPKMSMEVCDNIRGRRLEKAIALLEDVLKMKRPIVVRRFNRDLGHKAGYGPGRYPMKTANIFISLLNLAKANAENKGLNSENLVINFAKADFAERRQHQGRHRGKMKSAHVEIHVKEMENEVKEEKKGEA